MKDTFTVALMTDYGCTETCHPLAVGVDKATAKSIYRHFNKELVSDGRADGGMYVLMVSRTYCLNHEDFEHEVTLQDRLEAEGYQFDAEESGLYDDDTDWDDIFEPSAEDLMEWQMASCGLC